MLNLAALKYHQNKVYMRVTRQTLRDTLDPFDMPDERYINFEFNHLLRLKFVSFFK